MRPARLALAALVLALVARGARAQQPGAAAALPAGFAARVDSLFARLDRRDAPGCAVGVMRAGELAYARGFGVANLEYGVPLSPRSAFYVSSLAKQFTAASVLLLARDGKLSLDGDVRALLPELPAYVKGVTVRQLLHHTSGLRDYLVLFSMGGRRLDDSYTEADVLAALARQDGLNFPPGERYAYSNTGYVLLAMIVRRVSGQPLRAFAEQRLFAPLGMTHTGFHDDHTALVPERAVGYEPRTPAGGRQAAVTIPRPTRLADWAISVPNFELVGDGGLYSTVEDLARWEAGLARGAVGGRDFADSLAAPGQLRDGTRLDYANGLTIGRLMGTRRVGHGGAFGGYRAELLRLPEKGLAAAVLCNTSLEDATRLADRVGELLLGDTTPAAPVRQAGALPGLPVPVSEEVLAGWAGVYRDPGTGALRHVVLEQGRLIYARGPGYAMAARSPREFDVVGTTSHVEFIAPAMASGPVLMTVTSRDTPPQTYVRLRGEGVPADRWEEFVGRFRNDDTGAAVEITLERGRTVQLLLHMSDGAELPLAAAPDELFLAGDFAALRFERERGRVTGFILDADRVNGLRFRKY